MDAIIRKEAQDGWKNNPLKKKRDRHQALTVAYLLARYMPQYKFAAEEMKMFPRSVFDLARKAISEMAMPPGFG